MFQKQSKKGGIMALRDELKQLYEDIKWKQEQLQKQLKEIENKFEYWKQAYTIVESDLKIFKKLLKEF